MSKPFNIHDWQAKQRLAEHHAGEYEPDFLKQSVNTFLDKLKKKTKEMIKPLSKKSSVNEDNVINLLNYYELVNELKTIHG